MHRFIIFFLLITTIANAQLKPTGQNLVVITIDGMRWQEVFGGADSALLFDKKYITKDSAGMIKKYSFHTAAERRKALFPFLWNTVAMEGQVYGNRYLGNKVNNKNRYWFSYPGYNEIFTGFPDTLVNSNDYKANPNENVLAFLNRQSQYKNKVVAFTNWDAFKRILNEQQSGFMVNDGMESLPEKYLKDNPALQALNQVQFNVPALWETDRMDGITYQITKEFIKANHPKIVYLSFGETDEWAHAGKYDYYLDAAHYCDAMMSDLWQYLQSDEFYKGNTTLLITTDHGRGRGDQWTSHNNTIAFSNEIWFAAIGPSIKRVGEMKSPIQLYQAQLAQTIAAILGYNFTSNHPVENKVDQLFR